MALAKVLPFKAVTEATRAWEGPKIVFVVVVMVLSWINGVVVVGGATRGGTDSPK